MFVCMYMYVYVYHTNQIIRLEDEEVNSKKINFLKTIGLLKNLTESG